MPHSLCLIPTSRQDDKLFIDHSSALIEGCINGVHFVCRSVSSSMNAHLFTSLAIPKYDAPENVIA